MTDSPVGIAFVGAGMVSELHRRAIEMVPEAKLIGIHDADPELTHSRSTAWKCAAFDTYEALLAHPAVDAVYVLTTHHTHEPLAAAALVSGKHVLVEKPVADRAGSLRLGMEARSRGLVCMPGHNYSYQPEFRQLRRLVHDGDIGVPRAAWLTYAIAHPEEIASRYGGVLTDVMVHHSYLALALFGRPRRIFAGTMPTAWVDHPAEDQAWMTWEYGTGLSVHLFASFAVGDQTSDPWTFVVKVLGTRGGATYNWQSAVFQRAMGTLAVGIAAYEDSYVEELRAFVAAVRGSRNSIVSTLEDAALTAELLDLAVQASTDRIGYEVAQP